MTAIASAKMLLFAELRKSCGLNIITVMIRSKVYQCECFCGSIRFIFGSIKWQRKLFRKPFSIAYSSARKESISF